LYQYYPEQLLLNQRVQTKILPKISNKLPKLPTLTPALNRNRRVSKEHHIKTNEKKFSRSQTEAKGIERFGNCRQIAQTEREIEE
jgi:hypothetical protein